MAGLIRLTGGVQLEPHHSGALYWRAASVLVVSDLHFEKASSFARRGRHLPPYDTVTTLSRLEAVMERFTPVQVVCLGDSFHDADAAARMSDEDRDRLGNLCAGVDWIWVRGNHDPAPPENLGGRVADSITIDDVVFRHAMSDLPAETDAAPEVSGHFHPKATVPALGRNVTRPCFVYDVRRVVMPAFGAFTGGLNVRDPAFLPRFAGGFDVAVLGERKLHWFTSREIAL